VSVPKRKPQGQNSSHHFFTCAYFFKSSHDQFVASQQPGWRTNSVTGESSQGEGGSYFQNLKIFPKLLESDLAACVHVVCMA